MDKFSLAFSVSPLGPKSYQRLLANFKTSKKAWGVQESGYKEAGIRGISYEKFEGFRESFNIEKYISKLKKEKVGFISFTDQLYPDRLKKLDNPPIGLFCKGNINLLRHPGHDPGSSLSIAVVGTRKVTEYGKSVTENIVSSLCQNDVCIISGLALGVDAIAHRTTIENKGMAIAVLACGVDCCLPAENYSLYINILNNNGLIISEYPLSLPPQKGTFLARNRIIAALSDGILITEAAGDSGSLVTAEYGINLGKKVFAVPGPITSRMSDGSLKLLKQGASLVTNANDVLEKFEILNSKSETNFKSKIKNLKLSKEEMEVIELLEVDALTIDEIAIKTKIPLQKLFPLVSQLEMKKVVKQTNGKFETILYD